jgi:hypothetical protein
MDAGCAAEWRYFVTTARRIRILVVDHRASKREEGIVCIF